MHLVVNNTRHKDGADIRDAESSSIREDFSGEGDRVEPLRKIIVKRKKYKEKKIGKLWK